MLRADDDLRGHAGLTSAADMSKRRRSPCQTVCAVRLFEVEFSAPSVCPPRKLVLITLNPPHVLQNTSIRMWQTPRRRVN
jgi:hypothetical protein